MKAVVWMVLACAASCAALAAFTRAGLRAELLFGMAGPLLSAAVSWALIERAARVHPEGVSRLIMTGFVVKMLFFGAYVVIALATLHLEPVPFIVSFTSYFIGLHLTEALLLKRLVVPPQAAVQR